MLRRMVLSAGFAALAATANAASPPLAIPGEAVPPAVAALGPLDRAVAFGLAADGAVALAAFPSGRTTGRTVLRIGRADGTAAELELPGVVAGLAVAPAGDVAFAIARETDKKGMIRRVVLVRVDLPSFRSTSQVALPAQATGLAFDAGQASVLVTSKDELRSFVLPDLTSGPLYRVAGANAAVAPLAGTTRVLVAQGARLVVVDLTAPQDRDGLPIAGSIEVASPVRMLVSSPEEAVGLALLEDGSVILVETDPLRLVPRPPAVAIAWPGVSGAPAAAPVPLEEPPPVAAAPPEPEPEQVPVQVPVPAPPPTPVVPDEPGAVRGTLSGPARSAVLEVVLLGPDNVLKEAARVVPDASGAFSVAGLRTGSYRIVAAGENGRVLICEPPYVTVKVSSGAAVDAPALDVLRAH